VSITRVAVWTIGGLVLLNSLGVAITPLLTALGVGGLAVALALQDTLSNLFAGVHILASRKVQPGDFIQLDNGMEGYVEDTNWRSTIVRQFPNNILVVPRRWQSWLSALLVMTASRGGMRRRESAGPRWGCFRGRAADDQCR
jgi:small-conductance mechanosensitive channel